MDRFSNDQVGSIEGGDARQPVRCFWHGPQLSAYQLLCLESFRCSGYKIELYSYDPSLRVPDWVILSNANAVLPAEKVMAYQSGFGRGSPSLHSNLFRYALLHAKGGWWTDLDILLLNPPLPTSEFFFVGSGYADEIFTGILKFPRGHPLLAEAVERCLSIGEAAYWGQTGAELLTSLAAKHKVSSRKQETHQALPIQWFDLPDLFDPGKLEYVRHRCSTALCLHLFNEAWRGSGIPMQMGPPIGSFLDERTAMAGMQDRFVERMSFDHVQRWIVNRKLSIQREFEAAALNGRIQELETELEAVYTSTSWKVTAPVRRISKLLRLRR